MGIVTESKLKRLSRSSLSAAVSVSPAMWVRPKDWLTLPDVTGQQRMVGLVRIDNTDSNYLALTCSGAYTVDWGDGTVTNHAAGSIAQRQYTYSSIPNTGEATLGYRQVIVQVYPQTGNLTSISLNQKHNYVGGSAPAGAWLDITVNAPSLTSFVCGGSTNSNARLLERCQILSHSLTSCQNMFLNCTGLRSVPLFDTASVTNMTNMFAGCASLTEVPLFNTAAVTTMASMFTNCRSLLTVPLFNMSANTSMANMFQNCSSLTAIPAFNTSNVTSFTNAFANVYGVTEMPALDYSKGINCSSLFIGMSALKTLPVVNLTAATAANSIIQDCWSLPKFEATGGSLVTTWQNAFSNCLSLSTISGFSAAGVTSASFVPSVSGLSTPHTYNVAGINATISFANCRLSAAAINTIFTNLSNTGSGKTVTVTSNPGAATCDQSIATAKGWTVAV